MEMSTHLQSRTIQQTRALHMKNMLQCSWRPVNEPWSCFLHMCYARLQLSAKVLGTVAG